MTDVKSDTLQQLAEIDAAIRALTTLRGLYQNRSSLVLRHQHAVETLGRLETRLPAEIKRLDSQRQRSEVELAMVRSLPPGVAGATDESGLRARLARIADALGQHGVDLQRARDEAGRDDARHLAHVDMAIDEALRAYRSAHATLMAHRE